MIDHTCAIANCNTKGAYEIFLRTPTPNKKDLKIKLCTEHYVDLKEDQFNIGYANVNYSK